MGALRAISGGEKDWVIIPVNYYDIVRRVIPPYTPSDKTPKRTAYGFDKTVFDQEIIDAICSRDRGGTPRYEKTRYAQIARQQRLGNCGLAIVPRDIFSENYTLENSIEHLAIVNRILKTQEEQGQPTKIADICVGLTVAGLLGAIDIGKSFYVPESTSCDKQYNMQPSGTGGSIYNSTPYNPLLNNRHGVLHISGVGVRDKPNCPALAGICMAA